MRVPWKWLALAIPVPLLVACSDQPSAPKSDAALLPGASASLHAAQTYTIRDLGTLGGSWAEGRAINDEGWVVGLSQVSIGVYHAFLWKDGHMADLGTLGGTWSKALGINNAGEVVGASAIAGDAVWHAFLWRHGRMRDLGGLGGSYAEGFVINDRGDVAGGGATPDGFFHAALFRHGKITDLGTLTGAEESKAFGVNDLGMIVGTSGDHALLDFLGSMIDLNTLIPANSGWTLTTANGINDLGEIVGTGLHNGIKRGFILKPRWLWF